MALELIARSVFAVFALFAFKYLLSRVKRTLESLTGQTRFIIQEIGDLNEAELSLPSHDDIADHSTQMIESTQLVDSLFRSDMYNYCCMNGCDDQLDQELNRTLERLLDNMQLQQARNVKDILKLSRQNRDDCETKGLMNKLLEHSAWETSNAAGDSSASTSSASELGEYINTELVASLEAQVEALLKVLTDVVIEVKDKTLLLIPILEHLKSTLNCIKLLLTDIVEHSTKVLDIPIKELEDFGNQIKNGMELVQKCSSVDHWTSNEKHKYTNQLFEWDESLQRQLGQLMLQATRNVKDTLVLLRNVQEAVKRIDMSGVIKNELKLALEVAERIEGSDVAINELELDAVEGSIEGSGMEKDEFELDVAEEKIERSCVTKDEFELDVSEERIEGSGMINHELQLDVGEEIIERPSGAKKNELEFDVMEERIEGSSVAKIELALDIAKEKIEGSGVTKNELELDVGEEKIEESGAANNELELDVVEERIEENGLTKNEFELDVRDEGIEGSGAAKNELELNVVEERIEGNGLTKNEFKLDVRDEGIEGNGAAKNELELDLVEERIEGNGLTKKEFELDVRDEGVEGNGLAKNDFELDVRDEGVEGSGVAKNELELDVVEEFEGNGLTKNEFDLDVRDEGIEESGEAKNEFELDVKEERIEGRGVAKNEFKSDVMEETIQGNDMTKNILELDVTEEKIEGNVVAKNEFELNVAEKRIEGSGVAKNELALNVVEVQGTRDVRETLIHEELCPVYECSMVIKYEPISSSSSLDVLGHKTRKTEHSKRKSLKDVGSLIFKRVFWRPSSDKYAHAGSDVVGKVQGLLWYKDIGQYMNGDFSMAIVQANNLLEDQSQLESGPLSFLESGPYGTFLGVYDGHGGPDTSRYISDHLFQHLKRFASEHQSMSVDIIRKSYKATEEGFFSIVTKQWSVKPEIAAIGSCCLTGVICGATLYIANVGDSRAVLGRVVHGKIIAIQLSEDHNVAIESVRQEMHSLHPDDPHIVVLKHNVWRVKGLIRISRSIGDAYLKKPEFIGEPLNHKFCIRESFTRPILSAEPAISVHELQVHDQFLIFASDGLWEYLNNQEAVDIVQTHPHNGSAQRLVEIALREAAKRRHMTYSYLKKIGRGVRRHFHDDITVIVIFLDSNLVSRASSTKNPILSVRGGGVR